MTPSRRAAETARKRAERQRRKEAGEVRVEVWLDRQSQADLAALEALGRSRQAVINDGIDCIADAVLGIKR